MCGQLVCGACSPHRLVLKNGYGLPVRVCSRCFEKE